MKIDITDKKVVTSASISISLSDEREVQAFKNLLSWAEMMLFKEATDYKAYQQEYDILKELQKIKTI